MPHIKNDLKFDDYMECANYCSKILSSFKNSVKYIGIFKNDNLISVLIRPGFHPYNYEDFKKFDKSELIKDFFILKHPLQKSKIEKLNIYYIKLKTKK